MLILLWTLLWVKPTVFKCGLRRGLLWVTVMPAVVYEIQTSDLKLQKKFKIVNKSFILVGRSRVQLQQQQHSPRGHARRQSASGHVHHEREYYNEYHYQQQQQKNTP